MAYLRARCGTVALVAAGLLLVGSCGSTTTPPARVGYAPVSGEFLSVALNTTDPATERYGYSLVDVTPDEVASVTTGQRALVWLGGYDKKRCRWNWTDAEVGRRFARYNLVDAARIVGYFIADEPNTDLNCPGAAADVRARAALVRSLDPNTRRFTMVNVDRPDHFAAFRGTTDVMSVNVYPCLAGEPCDWSKIPRTLDRLREAGVTRYMGMLQAFSFEQWRWPTADELAGMIAQWQRSDWLGQLTFSWEYEGGELADHPELLRVLKRLNDAPHELFPLPSGGPA
ncbi:hypothetical protein [Streptomyces justiciae]|uniref:Uncharacterized protein n=1 Tax=Streptomyces justiciae TaxID=2780140 RepID=A0ABU3LQY5_9ACTN|nr:hypothetical protein [Streptomyces justiciae]MDT7841636.1 hypothetical protein [Streptomyces justiciae]